MMSDFVSPIFAKSEKTSVSSAKSLAASYPALIPKVTITLFHYGKYFSANAL
jgi:hypothetical protein